MIEQSKRISIFSVPSDNGLYQGNLDESNRRHGFGHMQFIYNEAYKGEWHSDLMHGYGLYQFADGSKSFTQWSNGRKHGLGVIVLHNEDTYVGWFSNNLKEGYGAYISVSGAAYHGSWKNDLKNGKGKTFFRESCLLKGEFLDGRCHGMCTKRNQKKNCIIVSYFVEGKPYGDGIKWSQNLTSANRLRDGKTAQAISAEEARRSSEEIGLPVPSSDFVRNERVTKYNGVLDQVKNIIKSDFSSLSQLRKKIDMLQALFISLDIPLKEEPITKRNMQDNLSDQLRNLELSSKQNPSISFSECPSDVDQNNKIICEVVKYEDGIYSGQICSISGHRMGEGTMFYDDGGVYEGEWKFNVKEGSGIFIDAVKNIYSCHYIKGQRVGIGVKWNADRSRAWMLYDGNPLYEISLQETNSMCLEQGLRNER